MTPAQPWEFFFINFVNIGNSVGLKHWQFVIWTVINASSDNQSVNLKFFHYKQFILYQEAKASKLYEWLNDCFD